MRQAMLVLAVLLTAQVSFAQSVYKVTVRDQETKAPVVDAVVNVKGTEITATTDAQGVGYGTTESKVTFPPATPAETVVFIKITNELGEKMSMRPANVSMVFGESTGIKVQQTSATTQTQSVRIQGLDGRYTQLLKDGFPPHPQPTFAEIYTHTEGRVFNGGIKIRL